MKTKLNPTQKSCLTSAILSVTKSNHICKRYYFTRRTFICNLLLRAVSLNQPFIYVYNALGRKTQIQMFRIIAYIIDYRSGDGYDSSFFKNLYGDDIVEIFEYMLTKHSKYYL